MMSAFLLTAKIKVGQKYDTMKKTNLLYPGLMMASLLLFQQSSCTTTQESRHPNVIYIYADDLGYGDLGCYEQQYIRTPHIDRIASEGILFTQHYSGAPVCAPARSSVMTGKHLGNAAVRDNYEIKDSLAFNTGQAPLPKDEVTIGEMLKESGYTTAFIGKWGLGSMASEGAPNKQGFDFFYGYNDQVHAHNHYPEFLWRNETQEFFPGNNVPSVHPRIPREQEVDSRKEYKKYMGKTNSQDAMTSEAIQFIKKNREQPFFLFLAYIIPHKALQVPDEYLESYNGVFDEEPYDGKRGYTPHPRPLSAYAAMITKMDSDIGKIIQELIDLNIDENTIVMFTSDNGPAVGGGLDPRFFNSSGGLRGVKGQLYEGGIRVPFVAKWPGKIEPGSRSDLISAHYDLKATFAELTGRKVEETDGISFLPVLTGRAAEQREHNYLYWEFPGGGGQYAVRKGEWKGVRRNIKRNPHARWEVYNLDNDPGELNDLSEEYPHLISEFEEIVNKRTPSEYPEWNY
jgi:arylsulfatase A-like enzyme